MLRYTIVPHHQLRSSLSWTSLFPFYFNGNVPFAEHSLGRLRMMFGGTNACAMRRAQNHRAAEPPLGSIAEPGRVVYQLIDAGIQISPGQLSSALGPSLIKTLAEKTGMSEQDVTAQLSNILPAFVDKLTPQGRVPTHDEIARFDA